MLVKRFVRRSAALGAALAVAAACGDDDGTGPTDVTLGETTIVVVVNPVVNDDNAATVPTPGSAQSGVSVSVEGGPSTSTNVNGVAVLSPVPAGSQTVSVGGNDLTVTIAQDDLREVAVASSGNTASLMANVPYALGGQVVEILPSMSLDEVNTALAQSNTIVLFRAGTYTGEVAFTGSNVTLFGEGSTGGSVTLNGNVTVNGSGNRIRGARITGDLTVPGSDVGVSFTTVNGNAQFNGSDATLLNNTFCGSVTIQGSGLTALGNAGMAPVAAPSVGC